MATFKDVGVAGQGLAENALNERIDKLFACGIGEYVNLPQLVVVGDQSSGKSSVLEGLTKLNFPRDSGLCTRFATQIVFRREPGLTKREISASIIPSSDLGTDQSQALGGWRASGLQSLNPQGFSQMMQQVHKMLGLSSEDDNQKPTFSNSVLKIDIAGPEESHLSVIDVPGIFKNTTPGRTTKNDIGLVRNMVEQYMKNPRSIMLAVVPANVDIATQEIIEMAHDEDPDEQRTLKILTKPDLVDKGAEHRVVKLINDGRSKGQLGWVLVRNLSQKEMDDGNIDRDTEENLFHQTSPWNRVLPENYGIEALTSRIQELHTSLVRREFPSVHDEVIKKLKESKKTMNSLGNQRDTPEQQRRVLLQIVSAFQDITRDAIATNYGAHAVLDDHDSCHLATRISSRNALFSDDLALFGHTYAFGLPADESEPEYLEELESLTQSRKSNENNDLREILVESEGIEAPIQSDILVWIKKIYQSSRGFELGTFNHTLLSTLIKKQTVRWPSLTCGYISDIVSYVHVFIESVLEEVCNNRRWSSSIMSILREMLLESYQQAISTAQFLLKIEREGTPITLNHYLNDNLEKCRQNRFQASIADKVVSNCSHGEVVRLNDLAPQHHMSNEDHTVQDIHDILESYCKVARKRFVDNVCMQAVDHCLLTGPGAPMKLISATWVNELSNKELEQIAGEDMGSKRRRQLLQKEIASLEEASKALVI